MAQRPSIVPGPMAGYESPEPESVSGHDWMGLVAASLRSAVGIIFVGVAVLYFPVQLWTPIMTGIGILMVVNGSLGVWKVGRDRPGLRPLCRALVWSFAGICVGLFAAMSTFGAGFLGPEWSELASPQEPATFQPLGVPTP